MKTTRSILFFLITFLLAHVCLATSTYTSTAVGNAANTAWTVTNTHTTTTAVGTNPPKLTAAVQFAPGSVGSPIATVHDIYGAPILVGKTELTLVPSIAKLGATYFSDGDAGAVAAFLRRTGAPTPTPTSTPVPGTPTPSPTPTPAPATPTPSPTATHLATGTMDGSINGLPVNASYSAVSDPSSGDMTSQAVGIGPQLGPTMKWCLIHATVIGVFAKEELGALNGLSLTGGNYTRELDIHFDTGQHLTVTQSLTRIGSSNQFVVHSTYGGSMPPLQPGRYFQPLDYVDEMVQLNPTTLRLSVNRRYLADLDGDGTPELHTATGTIDISYDGAVALPFSERFVGTNPQTTYDAATDTVTWSFNRVVRPASRTFLANGTLGGSVNGVPLAASYLSVADPVIGHVSMQASGVGSDVGDSMRGANVTVTIFCSVIAMAQNGGINLLTLTGGNFTRNLDLYFDTGHHFVASQALTRISANEFSMSANYNGTIPTLTETSHYQALNRVENVVQLNANTVRIYANGQYLADLDGNGTPETHSVVGTIDFLYDGAMALPFAERFFSSNIATNYDVASRTVRWALDASIMPSTQLELAGVVSRKVHGAAGPFDILLPLTSPTGIECRSGGANGNHTLVFTFSKNVVSGNASIISGTGSVAGSAAFSGNTMTVNLTGVNNAQTVTVAISNVTDSNGLILPDTSVSMGLLLGDTSGDGAVDDFDVAQTQSRIGQTVAATNFRSDVDAGGAIDATDVAIIQSNIVPSTVLRNISTRTRVQTGDNVGIGGFIITGGAPKHVILRAIGPSITGLPGVLVDPVLELHGPAGFTTVTNNNWQDDPAQAAAILATGLAPTNNLEAAINATLNPGAYTGVVKGNGGTSGIGLVEVYDLSQAVPSKLANISTRALVGTGNDIVIAGFILGNSGMTRIVVRGIGGSLTVFGVPNALANPTLELRDNNAALLASNDNWQDDPAQATELTAAGLAPSNPLESGIAATLPPGTYTALLGGLNNSAGIGVVEVYDRGAP